MVDRRVSGMITSLLVEKDSGSSKTKVGTKSVNDHGASNVCRLENIAVKSLIGSIEDDFKQGNDDKLEVTDTAKKRTHRDEHCSCNKVSVHHSAWEI